MILILEELNLEFKKFCYYYSLDIFGYSSREREGKRLCKECIEYYDADLPVCGCSVDMYDFELLTPSLHQKLNRLAFIIRDVPNILPLTKQNVIDMQNESDNGIEDLYKIESDYDESDYDESDYDESDYDESD
jgi:hypothetical protein